MKKLLGLTLVPLVLLGLVMAPGAQAHTKTFNTDLQAIWDYDVCFGPEGPSLICVGPERPLLIDVEESIYGAIDSDKDACIPDRTVKASVVNSTTLVKTPAGSGETDSNGLFSFEPTTGIFFNANWFSVKVTKEILKNNENHRHVCSPDTVLTPEPT